MDVVEYSKCKKCGKVRHVSELKNNPSGVGLVCVDTESCEREQSIDEPLES